VAGYTRQAGQQQRVHLCAEGWQGWRLSCNASGLDARFVNGETLVLHMTDLRVTQRTMVHMACRCTSFGVIPCAEGCSVSFCGAVLCSTESCCHLTNLTFSSSALQLRRQLSLPACAKLHTLRLFSLASIARYVSALSWSMCVL